MAGTLFQFTTVGATQGTDVTAIQPIVGSGPMAYASGSSGKLTVDPFGGLGQTSAAGPTLAVVPTNSNTADMSWLFTIQINTLAGVSGVKLRVSGTTFIECRIDGSVSPATFAVYDWVSGAPTLLASAANTTYFTLTAGNSYSLLVSVAGTALTYQIALITAGVVGAYTTIWGSGGVAGGALTPTITTGNGAGLTAYLAEAVGAGMRIVSGTFTGTSAAVPSAATTAVVAENQGVLGSTVCFNPVSGATGYNILRCSTSGGTFVQVATVNAGTGTLPSYFDAGQFNQWYEVQPFNPAGNGTTSTAVQAIWAPDGGLVDSTLMAVRPLHRNVAYDPTNPGTYAVPALGNIIFNSRSRRFLINPGPGGSFTLFKMTFAVPNNQDGLTLGTTGTITAPGHGSIVLSGTSGQKARIYQSVYVPAPGLMIWVKWSGTPTGKISAAWTNPGNIAYGYFCEYDPNGGSPTLHIYGLLNGTSTDIAAVTSVSSLTNLSGLTISGIAVEITNEVFICWVFDGTVWHFAMGGAATLDSTLDPRLPANVGGSNASAFSYAPTCYVQHPSTSFTATIVEFGCGGVTGAGGQRELTYAKYLDGSLYQLRNGYCLITTDVTGYGGGQSSFADTVTTVVCQYDPVSAQIVGAPIAQFSGLVGGYSTTQQEIQLVFDLANNQWIAVWNDWLPDIDGETYYTFQTLYATFLPESLKGFVHLNPQAMQLPSAWASSQSALYGGDLYARTVSGALQYWLLGTMSSVGGGAYFPTILTSASLAGPWTIAAQDTTVTMEGQKWLFIGAQVFFIGETFGNVYRGYVWNDATSTLTNVTLNASCFPANDIGQPTEPHQFAFATYQRNGLIVIQAQTQVSGKPGDQSGQVYDDGPGWVGEWSLYQVGLPVRRQTYGNALPISVIPQGYTEF